MIFGGTTEGKQIVLLMEEMHIPCYVSVATAYGEKVLPENMQFCKVITGRKDVEQMCDFMRVHSISKVLDATHPFATEVTQNIKNACRECHVSYLRILREQKEKMDEHVIYVSHTDEAVRYLSTHEGRILLTVGSKELGAYTKVPFYKERMLVRMLPLEASIAQAERYAYPGEHLLLKKGPFSVKENEEDIRAGTIDYLVTKETGREGGYPEKIEAVRNCGIQAIVIRRPKEEGGMTVEQYRQRLQRKR